LRILIDESLHRDFERELGDLDVSTVGREGWPSLRNGVLLRAAVARGFDVLITRDRAMRSQQNLEKIGIAVLVLVGVRNRIDDLRMLASQILSIAPLLRPGDVYEIGPLRGDLICDRPVAHRAAVTMTG
jgi:hypothetical protein